MQGVYNYKAQPIKESCNSIPAGM